MPSGSRARTSRPDRSGMPPAPTDRHFQYTVDIQSRLNDPGAVRRHRRQGPDRARRPPDLRSSDVARIELGAQTYAQDFKLNGKPAAGIAIYQTPEANSLQVGKEVAAKMAELSRRFPQGLHYTIPYDTTIFVNDSINEVYKTLYQAGILVLIVILVFLQNFRATLVPATTVPVTIIGAFAGMAALGFTVNLSTLFGIVLAIGIVVDDAIVIVEGVTKYIEQGMSGHDAAIKAMDELFGPIIGITLVLMAVFLPAAFVPGPDRQHVRPVRAGDRRDGADQRGQCRHAQTDAMRAVASHAGAAGASAISSTAASTTSMTRWKAAMPASSAGMVRRSGMMVLIALAARRASASGASPVCRPRSFRSTTRATFWCRAVARRRLAGPHRDVAGSGQQDRARRSPASSRSSPFRGCRCSITARTSPMPAPALSCSSRSSARLKAKDQDLLSIFRALQKRSGIAAGRPGVSCCRRRRSRASAMPAGFKCNWKCSAAASTTRS